MLKRAYLAITRRKNKTIILAIILFIIANLVLSSITIKNATEEALNYAIESLGSEVSLMVDQEKLREEMHANYTSGEMEPGAFKKMEQPKIYLSDVETISNSEYVIDYSYGFNINANAVDFVAIESSSTDLISRFKSELDMGDISIQAINAYALISEVMDGSIELLEGEVFDENNEDDVIISYELALANELEVGDVISLETNNENTVTKEFTIIGIYDQIDEETESTMKVIDPSNKIYMNINSGISLMSDEQYNSGDYEVSNIAFYLNDPQNSSAFIEEEFTSELEERKLVLNIDEAAYEAMVGPIEGVAESSASTLIVVVIAAVAILSLLIVNQIKDRKYEIGVLLSLGEKKIKISMQLLAELILIATFAFTLSLGTSSIVSEQMGNNLLESQISMSEEKEETNFGRGMGMIGKVSAASDVEVIDELNINASSKDYLLLYLVGYLIIVGSLIIPTTQILKYEPKTILTGREN